MEYLIRNIIKRMEDLQFKENEVFNMERISVSLDSEKNNKTKRKKDKDIDKCY